MQNMHGNMRLCSETLYRRVAGGLLAVFLSAISANAGAQSTACQGMSASWHDVTGAYGFTQTSNGSFINSILTTNAAGNCPGHQDYTISGSLVNGALNFTATWHDDGFADNNPRPSGCAQTITYSGAVTGAGCVHGDGTLTNSGGLNTQFHMVGASRRTTRPERSSLRT